MTTPRMRAPAPRLGAGARRTVGAAALATAGALAAVLLSGCTLTLRDPGATGAGGTMPVAVPSPSPTAMPTPTPTPSLTAGASDTLIGPSDAAGGAADRDRWIAAATSTQVCSPDLTIGASATATVVRVEGSCGTLVIEADAGVVVADDVRTLLVEGTGATVSVLQVGAVTVTGDANVVRWSGSAPVVDDTGAANTTGRAQ
ncbi:DUF3060 domain-containing protein [Cnuibacter sp. UC19_7]|uniref:DUF3060 domain-containing protein n=1 Tax=Cnuibacter sp. UC19_7 TaxID=3350166 RepID=UPI00367143AD